MPTTARTTRTASSARTDILEQLKADHKRVKKAYTQFKKLDVETDAEACEQLVLQVLDELTVHAALEEELLYPAAREALAETDLIDEAEVEHESVHTVIEQLRGMTPADDKYAARFIVLCEYVNHHVKEEESEMFPKLERAKLDWENLAAEMAERRAELTADAENDGPAGAAGQPRASSADSAAPSDGDGESASDEDDEAAPARAAPPAKRSGAKTASTNGRKSAATAR